jgi:PAS domain-containing protein
VPASEFAAPGLFEAVFNASPSPLFVVDDDVRVLHFNRAAGLLLGPGGAMDLLKRGGELLHCLHATEAPEGCGRAPACPDCAIRAAVGEAFLGRQAYRRRAEMTLLADGRAVDKKYLVTASPFSHEGQRLALLGLEDISELVALRRIVPICANCKRIRSDDGFWAEVESYFTTQMAVDFTHGICPDCLAKYYPDLK